MNIVLYNKIKAEVASYKPLGVNVYQLLEASKEWPIDSRFTTSEYEEYVIEDFMNG